MIQAKVIADSISETGDRITTLQIRIHRYVWGQFLTHRVFSRNGGSSRAMPSITLVKDVLKDPAMPIVWRSNKAGMQAGEDLVGWRKDFAKGIWVFHRYMSLLCTVLELKVGLHKQWANRLSENHSFMEAIVTSTEFENFFGLRLDDDAQPEIEKLAGYMRSVLGASNPKLLKEGEWHLPYVTPDEIESIGDNQILAAMSAARCARVSYLKHDKTEPSIEEDLALCERLTKSRPIHASPFEHQATPMAGRHGNFTGWKQQRQFIEEDLK